MTSHQRIFVSDKVNLMIELSQSLGTFSMHASIQRSDQVLGGIDDVYRDIFELNPFDMDEIQSQIFDSDGQEATRPDAEEIKLMDTPNVEMDDEWINTLVTIQYDEEMVTGIVKRRKKDGDSERLQGKAYKPPSLIPGYMRWKCLMAPMRITTRIIS